MASDFWLGTARDCGLFVLFGWWMKRSLPKPIMSKLDDIETALTDEGDALKKLGDTITQEAQDNAALSQNIAQEGDEIHALLADYSDKFAANEPQTAGKLVEFLDNIRAKTSSILDMNTKLTAGNEQITQAGAAVATFVPPKTESALVTEGTGKGVPQDITESAGSSETSVSEGGISANLPPTSESATLSGTEAPSGNASASSSSPGAPTDGISTGDSGSTPESGSEVPTADHNSSSAT